MSETPGRLPKPMIFPRGSHVPLNKLSAILCLVTQSCLTLCDPMDCSTPGSSVDGDSSGKNTGVGAHALLQGSFSTQGSNPGLPHCRQILYQWLSHQGSPQILGWAAYPFSRGDTPQVGFRLRTQILHGNLESINPGDTSVMFFIFSPSRLQKQAKKFFSSNAFSGSHGTSCLTQVHFAYFQKLPNP